jgi:GNAT superfamily N-acetyltransferase
MPAHPYAWRTQLRKRLPWFLIDLGMASKGADCESVGAAHHWYNIDHESSGCYHCEVVRPGQLWKHGRDGVLRLAIAGDIPGIQRVRHSVRENRLVSAVVSDEDVRDAIERTGRGWVLESDGQVVAFAIGNASTGNLWALFVHPDHERRGHGRRLHDTAVDWLWSRGLRTLWLTTEPGTRAQQFYERAGWQLTGPADHGDLRYELSK